MTSPCVVKLKYIKAYNDRHGVRRHYFRRRGQPEKVLPGEPFSDEFMTEYRECLGGNIKTAKPVERTVPGSVRDALTKWYGSTKFKSLEPKTRLHYRQMLERELSGHMAKPLARLEPRHIQGWIDAMTDRPGAAKSLLKRLKTWLRWCASPRGGQLIKSNPAAEVEAPQYETEGFVPWDEFDAAAYERKWPLGTKQRLAYALLVFTGQRVSDGAKMGPQHVTEGRIRVAQAKLRKNKKRVTIAVPIHPKLAEAIASMKTVGHLAYLVTEYGKPYSVKGLSQDVSRWAREAGLDEGKTAHGLRKLAGARLAEAGCTEKEIMAVLGLSSIKEAALYTASAQQKRLADEAMKKQIEAAARVDTPDCDPLEGNGLE